ncbi:MAG: beta strand repeat-containing protein [Acidimicrobiales bacterium]
MVPVAAAALTAGVVVVPAGVAGATTVTPPTTFAQLSADFATGGTYKLGATITAPTGTELKIGAGKSVTLDLAGHDLTVTNPGNGTAGIYVPAGASLTIKDSVVGQGTLTATGGSIFAAGIGGDRYGGVGSITIDGGTVIATGGTTTLWGSAGIGQANYAGSAGSITINGGTVTATGAGVGAGIGAGYHGAGYGGSAGTITINGGTVHATGGADGTGAGAGIGQSGLFDSTTYPTNGSGGTITIAGGTVTATGGTSAGGGGAGIGGGSTGTGSVATVTIDGGTVTATGGTNGAGIGGGMHDSGGTVAIDGGTVTATGGAAGAGIGGGNGTEHGGVVPTNGGTVTIDGGTVTATDGIAGAGIGGGDKGSGATVTIGSGATVTAKDGSFLSSAIGTGTSGPTFGSLSNAGTLTLPQGADLTVPKGASATNSGTIDDHGSITGTGTITNTGTIVDAAAPAGTVSGNGAGPAGTALLVKDDSYVLDFSTTGVPGNPAAPGPMAVFATTVGGSDQTLPTLSLPAGNTFTGWYDGTTPVTGTTDLPNLSGVGAGPKTITLHATYHTVDQAPAFTSADTTTFFLGRPGSFQVKTTGTPAPAVTETGNLPTGVTLAPTGDGLLKGTPAKGTAGTYTITLKATNGFGSAATQTFTLTVTAVPITQGAPTAGTTTTAGSGAFTDQLATSGNVGAVTYTETHSADSTDVVVSSSGAVTTKGTLAAGTYTVSGTDGDAYGDTGGWSYILTVIGAPTKPTAPAATPGRGQATITWTAPTTGGTPITSYVVASATGRSCTWSSGPLTCTVTGLQYGAPYAFTVTAHNGQGTGPASTPVTVTLSVTAVASSPGYWLGAADGGIFSFGGGGFSGSEVGEHLNAPLVGMAGAPTGKGAWMVAADGGVFTFGVPFFGAEGGKPLNAPIVGMAAAPTGKGYWLVAADGGVFTLGNAQFYGSEGGKPLDAPIVGMAPTPTGKGYWLVAADGGVFTFGSARFSGSMGGKPLDAPMVGMVAASTGKGYWLVAGDGGVFAFGVPFFGSDGGQHLNAPVVGMAVG